MKKVLTVGVFDYFHLGHLNLFERAKSLGDYLIVAVQDGDYILKYKPEADVLYSTEDRKRLVGALSVVDEVITYRDVDKTVTEVDFDVFAVGADQQHSGFQRAIEWCESQGRTVVRMPRTEGICSSSIKAELHRDGKAAASAITDKEKTN